MGRLLLVFLKRLGPFVAFVLVIYHAMQKAADKVLEKDQKKPEKNKDK